MKKPLLFLLISLLVMATAGCQPQKKVEQNQPKSTVQAVAVDTQMAEEAKKTAKSVTGVEEATAVVLDQKITTAIKVTGFNRLKLSTIKKEVAKKISLGHDEYSVHVTSDKKLFTQLQEIEKQITEKNVKNNADLKKKLEKINEAMKG
ncbi:YhcN/YlaJ family sporulation lipoprotein [Desulforamulus aeronauticus]|uniref:Sporulation lipoprotein YhcN/YlaJ (Spore_YhcN_YlaJ) n=1 Tax=Desulforamulus aeronauticus DSM 10349 TaxID=1121421 RepID=A0A1M6NWZ0_9FIRM|nr:YhcN/YlaJ family sporulation lipoprotein [Desulforamulus aeronauticus]SHK00196.1 Sporulation lipoprotein YhcN/YlaJ (Spore_YhcN_YlaJ) [Desulforamulus aeronauticus DSM 10349]